MRKYILKKLLTTIPVLIGITVIDFLIMARAGSPIDMMTGPRMTEATKAALATRLGLDRPLWQQYLSWLWELLHGNLGYAYKSNQPVLDLILSHLGPTLLLMGLSLLLGLVIAVPLGVYSAVHRYEKRDYLLVAVSFITSSVPGFFLSMILIFLFTVTLGWLPSGGMVTAGIGGDLGDLVRHMIMPVTVLTLPIAASNMRYIRSSVLEILETDYLRTARAKGIGRRLVIWRHAMRNALVPIVTVIGMQIPGLVGGAVIVEKIFNWPGLGLLTMDAIMTRNYPLIMGVCLLSAVVVLLANFLTDILYALVDPTIRL